MIVGRAGPPRDVYLCCLGHGLAEDFDLEVTEGGVKGDRLFAFSWADAKSKKEKEKSPWGLVCQPQVAVATERERGSIDSSDQCISGLTITYTRQPPFPLLYPSRPLRHAAAREPTATLNPRRRPLL